MDYVIYGLCGAASYYLFSFYISYISLKNKVKYIEERIEKQRDIFESEISKIKDKHKYHRDIFDTEISRTRYVLQEEISKIYDKLEK